MNKVITHFRESDIRPEQMMLDKQKCVDADHQFLLDRMERWVTVECPACQSSQSHLKGKKHGFTYVECDSCGTIYTNPRPSQAVLDEFYPNSQNYAYWNRHIFPATAEMRRDRIFRPRAQRLLDYCRKFNIVPGTLLEVGAAYGIFCEEILKADFFESVVAVEPTPDLAQTCRNKGLNVIESPIEHVKQESVADVIAAFEVIEHLFSPEIFIEQCRRLLQPGGFLVLSCPNVRGFDVATLGLVSSTFHYGHINYFHPDSLAMLLKRFGFEVIEVQTPGRLDAELVRKAVLKGDITLEEQPLLEDILIKHWDQLGEPFQAFLADNCLSSHMWMLARKPDHASL